MSERSLIWIYILKRAVLGKLVETGGFYVLQIKRLGLFVNEGSCV
jgi:hypothetical protein